MTVEFSPEFMKSRLLDVVPPDTDVILLGENHRFLFHNKYFQSQFADFKANNIDICYEENPVGGKRLEHLIPIIGDKPEYMQYHWDIQNKKNWYDIKSSVSAVFPCLDTAGNVCENKEMLRKYQDLHFQLKTVEIYEDIHNPADKEEIRNQIEEMKYSEFYNALPSFFSPYSVIQSMKTAKQYGVSYSFVDDFELCKLQEVPQNAGRRNEAIAKNISDEIKKDGRKKIYYGGSEHLMYHLSRIKNTEIGWTKINDLQGMLRNKYNLKTYTVVMVETPRQLNPGFEGWLANRMWECDKDWINKEKWRDVYNSVKGKDKEFFVNLADYIKTEKSGRSVPDSLLIFPELAAIWEENYDNRKLLQFKRSPMTEADMWHRMDRDFNLKP